MNEMTILGQIFFGTILILILILLIGTVLLLVVRIADSILESFGLSLKAITKAIVDDWDKEKEKNNEPDTER